MLKDLDKRQQETAGADAMQVSVNSANQSPKSLMMIVIILVLLNIIGFLSWSIYQSNEDSPSYASKGTQSPQAPILVKEAPEPTKTIDINKANLKTSKNKTIQDNSSVDPVVVDEINKQVIEPSLSLSTKPKAIEQVKAADIKSDIKTVVKKDDAPGDSKPKDSHLSISRTQFSPKSLIKQKVARAEKALEHKDIAKAESLYEEVLILDPNHKLSRKKLAALWFGREELSNAINILSQGINLDSQDKEMRVMKARIYLSKGAMEQAYSTLKPLHYVDDVEYQSLLAQLAQELQQHPETVAAYFKLTQLQPHIGRWWLGLAAAYDSSSHFDEAKLAYKTALDKSNLSISSAKFAHQRIQALGE